MLACASMSTTEKTCVLGNVVRDPITGFTGTAIQAVTLLNGTIQFAVQPKCGVKKKDDEPSEPDKLPEAYNFDTHLLEFVEEGIAAKVTPPATAKLSLGDQVKDEITGIIGIAVNEAIFINGCRYFSVQPEKKDKKTPNKPDGVFVSQDQLTVLKKGVFKVQPVVAEVAATTLPARTPGGPTTRAMRAT